MANGSNLNVTLTSIRNGTGEWVLDNTTYSDEIKVMQNALFKIGYWSSPNPPDGYYGAYTVAAVKGFQKMHSSLTATGILNKITLYVLEEWSGTLAATRSTTPSVAFIRNGTQYAIQGDSGTAITTIRKLLNAKGYSCSSTGNFDASLTTVVKQFQSDTVGLSVDGTVGQATISVLENTVSNTDWVTDGSVNLSAGLLAQCGFMQAMLLSHNVSLLNAALTKYGFTTKQKVKHLLAQFMSETQYGTYLMEGGYQAGNGEPYGTAYYRPYYGGGFIHLTHESTYDEFSKAIDAPSIMENDSYATLIVAMRYPGESAGWFFRDYKKSFMSSINWDSMSDSEICKRLTRIVTGSESDYPKRLSFFNNIANVLK